MSEEQSMSIEPQEDISPNPSIPENKDETQNSDNGHASDQEEDLYSHEVENKPDERTEGLEEEEPAILSDNSDDDKSIPAGEDDEEEKQSEGEEVKDESKEPNTAEEHYTEQSTPKADVLEAEPQQDVESKYDESHEEDADKETSEEESLEKRNSEEHQSESSNTADNDQLTTEPQGSDVDTTNEKEQETEETAPTFQIPPEGLGDENVNYDLLQRQAKYIMDSGILNVSEFRNLNEKDKISAILSFLNSNPETSLPISSQRTPTTSEPEQPGRIPRPDMSQPMNAAERKRYSEYLRGENRITEIQNIPPKSRLFIGNLPLKNVAKEDLFRIFSPYGHIYQINIKNAFGFIQYDNPKSVRDAIEGESQEMNFGKKLILEISSSNSRPQYDHGDHGTNSSSTFISSTKRPFDEEEEEDMYSDNNYKRGKRRVPECVIYVKRTADRSYANDVFNKFRQGTGLETDMIFLKPRMELRKMINDAAYDGVWGVVLVNKTRNVDIQTFYKGTQGETKFDEYVSVSGEDAVAIFNNLKNSRRNRSGSAPHQAPPQQQYYGSYNMGPPPPQQAPPHIPQHYVAPPPQTYGAPPIAQGYNAYPAQPAMPAHVVPPMMSNPPPAQMDQQQLLSAIQNLPPNVVSSLLSMAQQQPQQQQQLLGIIQSMQPQQQMPAPGVPPPPNAYPGYPPPSAMNGATMQPPQSQPQAQFSSHHDQRSPQQQSPPVQQNQSSGNNNVQSLLDSLAQLQQK